jgi:hypothetical protein
VAQLRAALSRDGDGYGIVAYDVHVAVVREVKEAGAAQGGGIFSLWSVRNNGVRNCQELVFALSICEFAMP